MKTVLLVEDEPLLRAMTRDLLDERGFRVRDLADGDQALRLLEGVRFDAVVTDLVLPGASGLDILRRVRRLRPAPLVLLITAFGTVPEAVEAMRQGAYDFITKPFRIEDLEETLRRGLAELEAPATAVSSPLLDPESIQPLALTMAELERGELQRALRATRGRRAEAARRLCISRNALWKKLRKLGE